MPRIAMTGGSFAAWGSSMRNGPGTTTISPQRRAVASGRSPSVSGTACRVNLPNPRRVRLRLWRAGSGGLSGDIAPQPLVVDILGRDRSRCQNELEPDVALLDAGR